MFRLLGALLLVAALAACDTNTAALDSINEAELAALSFDAGYTGDPDAPESSDHTNAFPSTNAQNVINGWSNVVLASAAVSSADLTFANPRGFVACFEYRADLEDNTGANNFNTEIHDGLWDYYCTTSSRTETIEATEFVDIRLSFGGEKDERFDWTRFYVMTEETKDVCKDGGWQVLTDPSFRNQGQCIAYYQSNENSAHHD